MKTDTDQRFCPENIRKYFLDRELIPLAPDAYVDKLGDYLASYFQSIMDILIQDDISVLSGYYAKNICTEQKYVRKFYRDPQDRHTVLLVNIMLHRFVQDLYLLDTQKPHEQLLGMIRKYLPLIVGEPSEDLSAFLDMYAPAEQTADQEKLLKSARLAFACVTFTLIHESVHLMPQLYQASVNLIRTSAHFQDLDNAMIRELACDFTAIYMLLSPDMPIRRVLCEQMCLSAEELAGCAFVALHAESMYQLFRGCLHLGNRSLQLDQWINEPLNTRIKNLGIAIKITTNTDPGTLSIGSLDVSTALDLYRNIVLTFLTGCVSAMEIFAELAQKANELDIKLNITTNDPIPLDAVWFRMSSE